MSSPNGRHLLLPPVYSRLRPLRLRCRLPVFSRQTSSTTELERGHISVGSGEGLLFVNNVVPLRLQWLFRLFLASNDRLLDKVLKRIGNPSIPASDHMSLARRTLPPDLNIEVTEIIPRLNEGGLFVKYSRPPGKDDVDIERAVKEHLKDKQIKPWCYPFGRVDASRVLGRPWIEDLYRFPSQRLRVEFLPASPGINATELTPEVLYSLFRKYGKLNKIERQPSSSQVMPRFAFVEFSRPRFATFAKSCVHGFILLEKDSGGSHGTVLKITYERKIEGSWIVDWLSNHPRLVIPTIAALIAAITVIIFDPIRTFFIRMKIRSWQQDSEDKGLLNQIRALASRAKVLSFGHPRSEAHLLSLVWDDRKRDVSQLRSWLGENRGTFIVVQGPQESGKRGLVADQALKDREYKLLIDCKPIQEARGDAMTISACAKQVGYRPIFSWANSISTFFDMAAQGLIGTKAGFSETLDTQVRKILQSTSLALKQVALGNRSKEDRDSRLSAEEYLEAHPEKRPVVVIDNFSYKSEEKALVLDKVAEWAATLVNANIAHVIFLTDASPKSLNKALPNQVFRNIFLGDCLFDVGKKFILGHLEQARTESGHDTLVSSSDSRLEDLDDSVATVGGRLTDLEFIAHRIRAGESAKSAVNRIITQSISEIFKMYISNAGRPPQDWTPEQAWYLIREMANAADATVSYNQIMLSGIFGNGLEDKIQSLEQAGLISVILTDGRPHTVKPGRPVYHAAFKRITEDRVLCSRMDLAILTKLISTENEIIKKYEDELCRLGTLKRHQSQLDPRLQWVLSKIRESQTKIEQYEKESAPMRNLLRSER